jgi:predicted amidophosphoribosyltransferase
MELMQRKLRYLNNSFFRLYHLCYYFSSMEQWDVDRNRIILFKNYDERTIRFFITQSINFLLSHRMDKDLIIIRALSSKELKIDVKSNSALDRLGKSLSAVFGCVYLPEILEKERHTKPIKSLTLADRQKELSSVYKIRDLTVNLNGRKILIIDDVVTTGTTSCSIIKAVVEKYPAVKINIFSLAWTPTIKQQTFLQQNSMSYLNDPEVNYGIKQTNRWKDDDFENGLTNISIFEK